MCYVRGVVIGTHKKYTKEQAQAYMHDQCNYFNMLMKKVLKKKEYGEEFEYLLSELRDGPYWHLVKYCLTMIQEEDRSNSVSGVRYQPPEESSSSSDGEWETANDVLGR